MKLGISRHSRAKTSKKCTKKCDAREKLLFSLLNPLLVWRSCCRRRRLILRSLLGHFHDGDIWLQLPEFISFLFSYLNFQSRWSFKNNSPHLDKKATNWRILVVVVKLRHRAIVVIECFHMTSRRPYWCPKTMKRWPCWCTELILWELNSFLMQTLSFAPMNCIDADHVSENTRTAKKQ